MRTYRNRFQIYYKLCSYLGPLIITDRSLNSSRHDTSRGTQSMSIGKHFGLVCHDELLSGCSVVHLRRETHAVCAVLCPGARPASSCRPCCPTAERMLLAHELICQMEAHKDIAIINHDCRTRRRSLRSRTLSTLCSCDLAPPTAFVSRLKISPHLSPSLPVGVLLINT